MLKKVLITIVILLLLFLGFLYWSVNSTSKTFSKSKLISIENTETVNFRDYDSVIIAASDLYKADAIKKLFQGEQYRKAWSAKVKVPILFLDTLYGGMTIIKEGGGNQTHSLKLKSVDGIVYTLRSINKDAKPLIPEFLRTLGLENIVVDGISAQHPYGAVLVAELANSANVISTEPKIYFLPEQDLLGSYNQKFGNRLYMFEYESEGEVNWTKLDSVQEILDTEDLQEWKQELKDSLHIDERALVRSRLFDLLIGDWDRHTKQWGWAVQKLDTGYKATPIAADRDNAFFNLEGIIPSILSNKHVVPELRPFTKEINYMEGLVYPFDRYFLLHTSEQIFVEEAEFLQRSITDEVLENAVKVWPNNITQLDGEMIINTMKQRRKDLRDYAIKFNNIIKSRGKVDEPLKGSEDLTLKNELLNCFECE
ncbi:hypothetical protein [Winogradskyella ursingii]|uniref:hypothetical protein n=1 Tax=Winogradskyella ursingii TaxID=2686079 RepID=UPI001C535233|nr:hypothetical protein [Winogradskyella ursingii]